MSYTIKSYTERKLYWLLDRIEGEITNCMDYVRGECLYEIRSILFISLNSYQ
jgi:hypothetical protein